MKTRICFFLTLLASAFLALPVFGAADGSIVGWGSQVVGGDLTKGFVAIAAGEQHSLGLKSDGSIIAWGDNRSGQCNVPLPNTGFVAIAAGSFHSVGLKSDGSIVAWGWNDYGQCNVPLPNTGFVAIAAGDIHSLGLKNDGSIVGWGDNVYGQATPPDGNNYIAIAAGWVHSLALRSDGSVVGWGSNYAWDGSWWGQATPPAGNNYIAIAAGCLHSLALRSDGSIVAWGHYWYDQCNIPSPNTGFVAISAGYWHSLGLKSDGSIVAWGRNYEGQCNISSPNTGFVAVAAGEYHSLGLKSDGSIVAWGRNDYGQCNIPPPNTDFVAVAASGSTTGYGIVSGIGHSLGLKSNGSIVAWGWNYDWYGYYTGQCDVPSPNKGFVAVAAGSIHSLGLKQDGSIIAWGDNRYGQCNIPSPNTGFVAVAAGSWHSLGLKSDGSIVAWGWNGYGQCNIPSPNTGFVAVTASEYHSLGLKSDGSIIGWGRNEYGQATPPAGNNFIAISAGGYHSLALRSDGTIVGWGSNIDPWGNWYGQATSPAGNNFIAISAGYCHSLALRSDGTIVGWGRNYEGQATPPSGGNYVAIAAGYEHSLALRAILTEISSTETTLIETLQARQGILDNGEVTGDFNGVFDFNNFETITITTGPWAGKGFSKGDCQATLEGVPYQGIWHGFLLLKPRERKIYLKGSTSGEIAAIVEGYLTESVPDSNVYDHYQATWKVGRLGDATTSATINLNGTLSYQSSSEFPNTPLYILQSSIGGTISGHYIGHLSSVINHIRIADSNNPYFGEGFSIISYVSESGQGEGWTYDKVTSPGIVEMKGLFDSPLLGIVSATLDETKTPRTVSATIERVDLGLPPAPDLKVRTWGPTSVSPGQTINYIIEYRNDGLKTAEDIDVVMKLPYEVEFVSATSGGTHNEVSHEVTWDLGNVLPKDTGWLSAKVCVVWGLPMGTSFENIVSIPSEQIEVETDPTVVVSYEVLEINDEFLKAMGTIFNPSFSKNFYIDGTFTVTPEVIEPIFDYIENVNEIEFRIKVGVEGHSIDVKDIVIKYSKEVKDSLDVLKDAYDFNKSRIERQAFIDWAQRHVSISDKTYNTISQWNGGWCEFGIIISGMSKFLKNPVLLDWVKKADFQTSFDTSAGILIAEDMGWQLPTNIPDRLREGYYYYKELEKGHRAATSQAVDSHENQIAVARDPSVKYGPEGKVLPGQKLDYKVEYENEGEGIAFGVYFTDTLDEDLNDSTLEIGPVIDVNSGVQIAPPGTYSPATRTITWFVGQVDPNQGGYADFNVSVRNDVPHGTEIINYATIYFPSVPEETRTNSIVSILTSFGDIDRDLNVNLFDFAILANQWLQAPAVPSADIAPDGGDGVVDLLDLAVFVEHWLEGTSLAEHDLCPDDPNKVEPGACGCGVPDIDINGDSIPDCGFKYGDVNGDGEISAYDAALAAQCSEGLIELQDVQRFAADVDGNGCVSAEDADLIAQYAIELITVFPVELMNPKPTTVPTCGCP